VNLGPGFYAMAAQIELAISLQALKLVANLKTGIMVHVHGVPIKRTPTFVFFLIS